VNEDALRALVREVVARQMSTMASAQTTPAAPPARHGVFPLAWQSSHARYAVPSGEEAEGPCFIEPAVRCNHCGYCQSHGH
jgi:hypothetical protein